MSMSVDGFIAGPDDVEEHGLGVGGERAARLAGRRRHRPGSHRPADEAGATVFDEGMATGAVITGRRTFEFAGGWGGDHHDGVPIFVLTRAAPAEPAPGHARYVTDLASCVAQAKAAAGDRDVLAARRRRPRRPCLRAGLLDEIGCTSCRCCSGRAGGCSTTCHPSTSSSISSARWTGRPCSTCATACAGRAEPWRPSGWT